MFWDMGLINAIQKCSAQWGLAAALALSTYSLAEGQQLAGGVTIKPEARAVVYGINTIGNGVACALVAAAEKSTVLRDMVQCMFAGAIQSAGMEAGRYDVPVMPGIALRIVETGASIVENTLAGREGLEHLYYGLGPVLVQIDFRQGELKVYGRLLPAGGIITNLSLKHTLDVEESLSYQTVIFSSKPTLWSDTPGFTIGNVIYHEKTVGVPQEIVQAELAHEFAHVLQYVRVQPTQRAVPASLGFLEQKLHLRVGEDLTMVLLALPGNICQFTDSRDCARHWYDLTEVEAYTMQTAAR